MIWPFQPVVPNEVLAIRAAPGATKRASVAEREVLGVLAPRAAVDGDDAGAGVAAAVVRAAVGVQREVPVDDGLAPSCA